MSEIDAVWERIQALRQRIKAVHAQIEPLEQEYMRPEKEYESLFTEWLRLDQLEIDAMEKET